jgi:hypothetical protein
MAKWVFVLGTTTTITIKLQGLRTADETWIDLATATKTVAGTYYLHTDVPKKCRRYRLNVTVNAGTGTVTAYIGIGAVEN